MKGFSKSVNICPSYAGLDGVACFRLAEWFKYELISEHISTYVDTVLLYYTFTADSENRHQVSTFNTVSMSQVTT